MPITNTISHVFMTKPPSPATTQQMSTRLVSGARHSACQANGRCKSADIKAACLRFLYGMILEWKELPCKSAESAHHSDSKFRRPPNAGSRKGWYSIVTAGPPAPLAAKQATTTIPIVFAISNDPVAEGVVSSLARPGGNITGLTSISPEVVGKQLELLQEVAPRS